MPTNLQFFGPTNQHVILTRLVRFGQCLPPVDYKVLMAIYDRTFAYKKEWESIPYRHFLNGVVSADGTRHTFGIGVGETSLKRSICRLAEREAIFRQRAGNPQFGTYYSINIRWQPQGIADMWVPYNMRLPSQDK